MTMQIKKLAHGLGAEIMGVDLTHPLDAVTISAIRAAWLEHLVLVIRGQNITAEQHIAFSRHFGELELHPNRYNRHADHPQLYIVTNKMVDGRPSDTRNVGRRWHSDGAYKLKPSMGSELVAKSAPDGYTLLVVTSSHAVSAAATRNTAYDPVSSFTPITLIAATPLGLIGHLSAPVKTLRELLSFAKANPNQLNYGSSGAGSTTHLAGELLGAMAGIKLTHVPYRGGAPSMNELLGGQIHLLVISWPSAMPQIKAAKVTGLGITSAKRSSTLPDVPTFAESGVAGYEALQWYAALAPAGLPTPLALKLNGEITRIVRTPKVAEFINNLGAEVKSSTLAEFDLYLRAEVVKWNKLVQQVNDAAR